MHFRRPIRLAATALALGLGAAIGQAQGERASLLAHLPDAVVLAAEVRDGGELLLCAERALGKLPDDLPDTVRAQIAVGLLAVQTFLRAAPGEALHQLAGGGAAFGVVPTGKAPLPLLVLRPADADAARAFLARFPKQLHWAEDGDTLLVSATAAGLDLLRASARAPGRWAAWPDAALPASGEVRAYVDLDGLRAPWAALRQLSVEGLGGGGRFFFGPLVHAVAHAPSALVSLRATDAGFDLRVDLAATARDARWFDLMPARAAPRTVPAPPEGALAMLALDRSLQRLLAEPQRFLDDAGVLAIQGFLSVADQVDGATTQFVRDIVGSFGEPMTAYVLPTTTNDGERDLAPLVLLPGFAVCAPLARDHGERDLLRTASIFAVIANSERARQHQTPFLLRTVRDDGVTGITAEPATWRGPGRPPIDRGLSPSLLFGHGHVVLGSTAAAARAVLQSIGSGATAAVQGDVLRASGPMLAAALLQSRAPIELARQLDEGESPGEAAQFVTTLAAVLGMIPNAQFCLQPGDTATSLHLSLHRP